MTTTIANGAPLAGQSTTTATCLAGEPTTPPPRRTRVPGVDATGRPRRAVSERTFVQAIDRWLDGQPWEGEAWSFSKGRVHLTDTGDTLSQHGVAIVSRAPIRLHDRPTSETAQGKPVASLLETRTLAAIAVRGDAGMYDGQPPKERAGVKLVWIGHTYVQAEP